MRVECPKGYKGTVRVGGIALTLTEVNVCGGVCDAADLCKIDKCEFYDVTREGTRRFMQAAAEEETLEGFEMKLVHEAAARNVLRNT